MNWEMISAVAEIIGTLAVVISIIYLAVQVNQNTNASQGLNELELSKDLASWHVRPIENPGLRGAWNKAARGEELTEDEITQIMWFASEWFFLCEGWFQQYKRGLMSEIIWDTRAKAALGLFAIKEISAYWEVSEVPISPELKNYLEEFRAKGEANWNNYDMREILSAAAKSES